MFNDKVYEEMDDVEKMFEPFQYDLNDALAKFPDKVEVEFEIPEFECEEAEILKHTEEVRKGILQQVNNAKLSRSQGEKSLKRKRDDEVAYVWDDTSSGGEEDDQDVITVSSE